MKFQRNTRIFTGQLDPAAWLAVFILLIIFLLLVGLVYTPGVQVQIPNATDLPGTDKPTVAVTLDQNGQLYFENQLIEPPQLRKRLQAVAQKSAESVVLVIRADKAAQHESVLNLVLLARESGINDVLLAVLPRPFEPVQTRSRP